MRTSTGLKLHLIISGLLLTFIDGATLISAAVIREIFGIDTTRYKDKNNNIKALSPLIVVTALTNRGAFTQNSP